MISQIYHNNKKYLLHIVSNTNYPTYEKIIESLNICDETIISPELENLAATSLTEQGYYGFFISDIKMTKIYSFIIIDINCDKLSSKIKEYKVDIDASECVEIVLFCSNKTTRIPYLASKLFNIVIDTYIPMYKPSCNCILLSPGTKDQINLSKYYEKFGFIKLSDASNIMMLDLTISDRSSSPTNVASIELLGGIRKKCTIKGRKKNKKSRKCKRGSTKKSY